MKTTPGASEGIDSEDLSERGLLPFGSSLRIVPRCEGGDESRLGEPRIGEAGCHGICW